MASNTPNLDLYKKDPVADASDTFNITTMLNENWDKIDEAVAETNNNLASETQRITEHLADSKKWAEFTATLNQSVPNNASTRLVLNKISYNGEDFCSYDPSTDIIKILKGGIYHVQASVGFEENPTGYRDISISTIPKSTQRTPAITDSISVVNTSIFIEVTANYEFAIGIRQTSGASLNTLNGYCGMRIRKVS